MEKTLKKYFGIFALPTLLAFLLYFLIPFIWGIYLSFTRFTIATDAKWVGLQNYVRAFSNQDFLHALGFTSMFTVVSVISINVLAFFLAYLLTRGKRGTNAFRTIFFMPNLIGGIVLGYIWQVIFNGVLAKFGVTLTYSPEYGFWGLVIMLNWQMIGFMMVIYIAGIQNIPKELVDAAKVDGATAWGTLRHVTFPLVMPSITICLFLTLANSFKLFDQNLSLTNGEPLHQTAMLALDIYNTFYNRGGSWTGVGQAKAVVFFILVGVITLIQLTITRNKEVEN
jgi:raffinose/stachyose/melibiose transport system permease protein